MKAALAVLALTAAGGLGLAFLRITTADNPPAWMAMAHGLIAATALVTLIVAAFRSGLPALGKAALAVFVVAALGGSYLVFGYHDAGLLVPIPLVLLHGGLAMTGFVLLLAAILAQRGASDQHMPTRWR